MQPHTIVYSLRQLVRGNARRQAGQANSKHAEPHAARALISPGVWARRWRRLPHSPHSGGARGPAPASPHFTRELRLAVQHLAGQAPSLVLDTGANADADAHGARIGGLRSTERSL